MTSQDKRLSNLSSTLTASARGLLVLQSWKEGRDEDPAWRSTMPQIQAREFNRYIELMNGVNVRLLPAVIVVALEVDKLELRLCCLSALALWYVHAGNLEGELEHETGKSPLLSAPTPPRLPVPTPPRLPVLHVSEEFQEAVAAERERVEPSRLDELVDVHKERLREGVNDQTQLLQAADAAVAEAAEAFGGEDPAVPELRHILDHTRERLEDVRRGAEDFVGPLEVGEPGDELVEKVQRLVGLTDS